jgi:hypothetical protein
VYNDGVASLATRLFATINSRCRIDRANKNLVPGVNGPGQNSQIDSSKSFESFFKLFNIPAVARGADACPRTLPVNQGTVSQAAGHPMQAAMSTGSLTRHLCPEDLVIMTLSIPCNGKSESSLTAGTLVGFTVARGTNACLYAQLAGCTKVLQAVVPCGHRSELTHSILVPQGFRHNNTTDSNGRSLASKRWMNRLYHSLQEAQMLVCAAWLPASLFSIYMEDRNLS